MAVVFAFSVAVSAHPLNTNPFFDGEKHPLPPVNWVRSRKIDVKHLDISFSFDWDREQATGEEVITFAPFEDTDRFTLDAAMMTIASVTLSNGTALKYNYDGKAGDDNLEIMLDRIYKGGEDVAVKIDYKTNYASQSGTGLFGGIGQGLRFIKPTADKPKKPRQKK